jgi:hypothetical protein
MTPEERDRLPMGRIPWPILAVAAFAFALYEAVSHDAPPLALALVSVFAVFQVLALALWIFALFHNRRVAQRPDQD